MEYVEQGRATFRADVTHGERGDWSIRAGALQATLPLSGGEADDWVAAGKPSEPADLPERVEAFLSDVARASSSPRKSEPKRVKYDREDFAPLDGEERVYVVAVDKRSIGYDKPSEIVTGRVYCTSPRCRGREWLVVQLPGSMYDRATTDGERVESVTPHEFAEQHRAWHREAFPTSGRVELSEWIERHKDVRIPELTEAGRREIDLGVALTKSER